MTTSKAKPSQEEAPQELRQEAQSYLRTMALLTRVSLVAGSNDCQCNACAILRANSHHLDGWLQRLTDLGG